MEEIVYFELNNWFRGRDYPVGEPFDTWVHTHQFSDDDWCKENRLCVKAGNIDMSCEWCVSAPKAWVLANCPMLLSDSEYEYVIITRSNEGATETVHKAKYSDFVCQPDEDGVVHNRFGWTFPEYDEEDFGVQFTDEDW